MSSFTNALVNTEPSSPRLEAWAPVLVFIALALFILAAGARWPN